MQTFKPFLCNSFCFFNSKGSKTDLEFKNIMHECFLAFYCYIITKWFTDVNYEKLHDAHILGECAEKLHNNDRQGIDDVYVIHKGGFLSVSVKVINRKIMMGAIFYVFNGRIFGFGIFM